MVTDSQHQMEKTCAWLLITDEGNGDWSSKMEKTVVDWFFAVVKYNYTKPLIYTFIR